MSDNQIHREYSEEFAKLSDEEIVQRYKNDLEKPGVVRHRLIFRAVLRDEIEKRGIELEKKFYCPKCGKRVTKLPISNYRENGKLWHIPHFGKAKCDHCGWESEPYGKGLVSNTATAIQKIGAAMYADQPKDESASPDGSAEPKPEEELPKDDGTPDTNQPEEPKSDEPKEETK